MLLSVQSNFLPAIHCVIVCLYAQTLNWNDLLARRVKPPFVPTIVSHIVCFCICFILFSFWPNSEFTVFGVRCPVSRESYVRICNFYICNKC